MQPFGLALGAAVLTTVACRAYAFTATSSGGARFAGRATLSHHLPPPATVLTPPDEAEARDGVLQPGHEYTLAVGTVLAGGNASFVETTFATPDKESP